MRWMRICRQRRYDIVHAMLPVRSCDIYHPHAGMAAAGIQTHLSRRTLPGRTAARLANRLNRKRQAYARIERELLEHSDTPIVLCLSEYVKGSILQHYPHIGDRLVKLFNAVNLDKIRPARGYLAHARRCASNGKSPPTASWR